MKLQYEVTPVRVQEFMIPGRLDGLNEMIGAARKGWAISAKQKKENQKLVVDELFFNKIQPIRGPFVLDVTWVERNNARDPDNVMAGKKYILDGLQEMGIIPNDGRKQVVGVAEDVQTATPEQEAGVYIKLIEV